MRGLINTSNENKYLIGIDIGGTKCAVVLGDREGTIYDRISFPTETWKGPEQTIDRIKSAIWQIIAKKSIHIDEVESMGVSCGGPLDTKSGYILSPSNLPGWDEIPITQIIGEEFGKDVYLENDANACAVAEWKLGAGKGCKNMMFLTFGTGLGAGLILDGKLYRGTNDMAGEIGHIRLAEDGPIGQEKAGSFEGFCSGGGIAQLAQKEIIDRLNQGIEVDFCPSMENVKDITAKDVGIAASKGDEVATEILRISGIHLGMGLSILIDILNPERIIIGSIFTRCEEFLKPAAEEIIRKEALELSRNKCEILPAGLGEEIGDYASLLVAHHEDHFD